MREMDGFVETREKKKLFELMHAFIYVYLCIN